MEQITVRIAKPSDAAAVVPLLAELGYPSSEGQLRETLERLASTRDDRVFVAEQSTRLVGIASVHRLPLFHAPGYLGRITALVVSAPSRGAGVGRALLAAAEAYAWGAECVRIEVTSGDHRPDAHAFYERLGYQEDERRFIKRRAESAVAGAAG